VQECPVKLCGSARNQVLTDKKSSSGGGGAEWFGRWLTNRMEPHLAAHVSFWELRQIIQADAGGRAG